MTPMQQEVAHVTEAEVARALRQNHGFLGRFLSPHSPSQVAPEMGMAANLAHHHARKLADLGLLREVKRESGKVYYQLAAREFRVPWSVMPPVDAEGGERVELEQLTVGFWQAYERSFRQAGLDEEAIFGFGNAEHPVCPLPNPASLPAEPYPTHLDRLSLRLTPERYLRLVREITALLDEAAAEGMGEEGRLCTVAVLAFQGIPGGEAESFRGISRGTSSFLGAPSD